MRITHIYHSGFVVELAKHVLVFDWYTGELPTDIAAVARDSSSQGKQLVVFVSHAHGDHYGECIWQLEGPNTHYVLDDDLARAAQAHTQVTLVEPHATYTVAGTSIQTLESNDEGVAFAVECEGTRIFFAGDLNVWWWDRPLEENQASDAFCRAELRRLSGNFDVAFMPLDPRLKDGCAGIIAFEEELGAQVLVPMHYGDNLARAQELAQDARLAPYAHTFHFEDVIVVSVPSAIPAKPKALGMLAGKRPVATREQEKAAYRRELEAK